MDIENIEEDIYEFFLDKIRVKKLVKNIFIMSYCRLDLAIARMKKKYSKYNDNYEDYMRKMFRLNGHDFKFVDIPTCIILYMYFREYKITRDLMSSYFHRKENDNGFTADSMDAILVLETVPFFNWEDYLYFHQIDEDIYMSFEDKIAPIMKYRESYGGLCNGYLIDLYKSDFDSDESSVAYYTENNDEGWDDFRWADYVFDSDED